MPSAAAVLRARASVFAALGDETRLGLLARLTDGEPLSIARLTEGTRLTRQAVTKHLRVLEDVGVVFSVKTGRESRFALDPRPIVSAQEYLATPESRPRHTEFRFVSVGTGSHL